MRVADRYDVPLRYGVFERYRAISRKLRIKDHPETGKPRYGTWRIARAIPFYDRPVWAMGHVPQHWHPVPNIWIGWDPTQARYQTIAIVTVGYEPNVDFKSNTVTVRYNNSGRFIRLDRWLHEFKWSAGPMCRLVHSGQVLVAIDRGILPDIELMWASYCRGLPSRKAFWVPRLVRKPHGLIEPFARHSWVRVPVKDYERYEYKDFEVPAMNKMTSVRIFLVAT
jgi:hypothetical protein